MVEAAPARPAPAAPPAAPVLARIGPVVDQHFRTMSQFLDVQASVMAAYLHRGVNGQGNGNGHAARRLPFIDAVPQHEPGRALTALVHLDLERHPFFRDHTLGRDVSVEDPALTGLPVLPLTFSIEILAEAAAALVPGGVLASIEQVRAYRWITVADRATLVVAARARAGEPGAVDVSARQGAGDGQPYGPVVIEAVVRFAQALPAAPQRPAFTPRGARPSAWTADRLYRDGMFHGRAFQAVRSVDAYGDDGTTSTLVAPAPRGLFADPAAPELLTEAVLLDAAGQALAFWAKEHAGAEFDFFPFRVDAIRVFGPPPLPGIPVRCDVRASLAGDLQTTCDIDLVDSAGRAIYRIEGWEDRRFQLPRALLQLRIAPRESALAAPWDAPLAGLPDPGGLACCRLDVIPEALIEANHGIWSQMLAHLVLGRRERAQWAALTGTAKRRHEWLIGRAAAKDAVRRLLKARHGVAVAAADVEILPDAYGRPEVHGAWRDRLGIAPVVSIAHSGGVAVALAALDGRPLVGIDIERISTRAEGFEALAFGPDERRLLSALDDEARREWHLRFWCAKEAVGKALGRGLAPGIRALQVTEARVADGAVRLRLADSATAEFPALSGKSLHVMTRRDGDYVSSAIAAQG